MTALTEITYGLALAFYSRFVQGDCTGFHFFPLNGKYALVSNNLYLKRNSNIHVQCILIKLTQLTDVLTSIYNVSHDDLLFFPHGYEYTIWLSSLLLLLLFLFTKGTALRPESPPPPPPRGPPSAPFDTTHPPIQGSTRLVHSGYAWSQGFTKSRNQKVIDNFQKFGGKKHNWIMEDKAWKSLTRLEIQARTQFVVLKNFRATITFSRKDKRCNRKLSLAKFRRNPPPPPTIFIHDYRWNSIA